MLDHKKGYRVTACDRRVFQYANIMKLKFSNFPNHYLSLTIDKRIKTIQHASAVKNNPDEDKRIIICAITFKDFFCKMRLHCKVGVLLSN